MQTGTIALMGAGGLFLWSGFHGASVTGSLRDLLSGSKPAGTDTATLTADTSSTGTTAAPGDTSAHSASAAANQAVAKLLAAPYGWSTGQQWADLVSLWNRESGWKADATNPTSGAYGIPQALPASKMASAGSDWRTNPATQIKWGLAYIKSVYITPSGAWAHEQANGWY